MLLSHDDARTFDGLSRSQRERLVIDGLYPEPVRPTAGRVAFVREEVEKWVRDRIAARDERRDPSTDPIIVATAGKRGIHRLSRAYSKRGEQRPAA
jgi:predicted DNA-binding transcriptional regulator AlpA